MPVNDVFASSRPGYQRCLLEATSHTICLGQLCLLMLSSAIACQHCKFCHATPPHMLACLLLLLLLLYAVPAGLTLSDAVVAAAARQQLPTVLPLLSACCDAQEDMQGSTADYFTGGLSKLYAATVADDLVGDTPA